MSVYPGAIPPTGSASASDTLAAAGHTALHNAHSNETNALATKVGTGSSTPVSGLLLRGNGAGTSAWAQANLTSDVTGVLPQANGGTGTTLATGTGKAVYDTSPTISSPTLTTPTIASFTNANHNHQNSAGGGQLSAAAVGSLDLTNTTLLNPYKFSVYRGAAQNSGNGAFVVLQCDTKRFDTSSNVDIVTNKGRFTAPIAGFYWFSANWAASLTGTFGGGISLFKNGSRILDGGYSSSTATSTTTDNGWNVSGLLQLATNDYIEAQIFGSTTVAIDVSSSERNSFSGFLVSTT